MSSIKFFLSSKILDPIPIVTFLKVVLPIYR